MVGVATNATQRYPAEKALEGIFNVSMKRKNHLNAIFVIYSFSLNSNLKVHIDCTHGGIKKHQCDICSKRFRDTSKLKRHQHAVHKKMY
jgi:stress-induced morphogen